MPNASNKRTIVMIASDGSFSLIDIILAIPDPINARANQVKCFEVTIECLGVLFLKGAINQ